MNTERLIATFLMLAKMSSPTFKESVIIRRIINKLKQFPVDIERDNAHKAFGGSIGNLIATLPPKNDKLRPIAFAAHVDTVDPCQSCHPMLKNGVIRSNGKSVLGADDKAGVAIMIEALESVVESGQSHGLIQFIFTVAEEKGLLGSKNLDFSKIQCQDIIVLDGDGPTGSVITRAPSQNLINIDITGRSAHAGVNPDRGINAIHVASKALAELDFGLIDEETTANVGTMHGGVASNIVPDSVNIEAEVRSHDEAKLSTQTTRIVDIFESKARDAGAGINIDIKKAYDRFSLAADAGIIQRLAQAASSQDIQINPIISGGGSDANIFNSQGLTAVNLSVGYEDVHTVGEWLNLEQFIKTAKIVESLILMS